MHTFRTLKISLVLTLVMGSSVYAAESVDKTSGRAQPLDQALSSAYVNNSDLRAKLHEKYAVDESVSQAISAFRPKASVVGNTGRASTEVKAPAGDFVPGLGSRRIIRQAYPTRPKSASAQIKQNLYNGGSDLANLRASESGVKASEYDLIFTEQKTLQDAVTAYMNVIFQTAAVKSNESNVSYLEEQLKSMAAQVEVGEKTTTDLYSSESQLADGRAKLAQSQSDLGDAKANYLQVIGQEPSVLAYPRPLAKLPKTYKEVLSIAIKSNPRILNAIYAAEQAGYKIDQATGAILPKLDITAEASQALDQKQYNLDRTNNASAVLQLTIPIYQGGAEYSKVREQSQTAAQTRYKLEQARKSVEEDTTKAWDALVSSRQRITDLEVQVKAARKSRDNAQKEADVGERSYTEVLQFQSRLLEAEINLEKARSTEVIAQYGLYAAMGILNATELKLAVTLFDVEGHYDDVRCKAIGFGDTPKILEVKDEQIESTQD